MALVLPRTRKDLETLAIEAKYRWSLWRRPDQTIPDWNDPEWTYWMTLGGRGAGKTRTGAETTIDVARNWRTMIGIPWIHLIAPTKGDIRKTMVEGPAGILACSPPWYRPRWNKSEATLKWPNGVTALCFSADEPERMRGPQCAFLWADEVGAWRYPEAWDLAMLGLRLGFHPRAIITTTPRPTPVIKSLVRDPYCRMTKASTYDNQKNLSAAFFRTIVSKYEKTRMGKQEIYAELIEDAAGALWTRNDIDEHRVSKFPDLVKIVTSVDPAVTATEDSCDTGIITAGRDKRNPPHYYVLADDTVEMASPKTWAKASIASYSKHQADEIVVEVNNGGDMCQATIENVDEDVPVVQVRASRGKRTRAEPVAALSEQGRLHFVGYYPQLEDQCCQWVPGEPSPDRLDSLVWAITRLMEKTTDFRAGRA